MIVTGTIELDGKSHSLSRTTRGRGGREGFTVEHLMRYIAMMLRAKAKQKGIEIIWSVS